MIRRSDSFEQILGAFELAKHRLELSYRQHIARLTADACKWRRMYEAECRKNQAAAGTAIPTA